MGDKIIQNINDYILEKGISIRALAESSGILYNSLWKILNRNKNIRIEDYAAICEALNKPLDFFIPKE